MTTRRSPLLLALLGIAACGGQVIGTSSGDGSGSTSGGGGSGSGVNPGGPAQTTSPGGPGSSTAGPGLVAGAQSILVSRQTLGLASPGGGCSPSFETITYDFLTNQLTVMVCEAPDAAVDEPSTMVIRNQRALAESEIAKVHGWLDEYSEVPPPAKSQCSYDGVATELDVTTASTTTRYWDQAYNCNYPPDVKFAAPALSGLFAELDTL